MTDLQDSILRILADGATAPTPAAYIQRSDGFSRKIYLRNTDGKWSDIREDTFKAIRRHLKLVEVETLDTDGGTPLIQRPGKRRVWVHVVCPLKAVWQVEEEKRQAAAEAEKERCKDPKYLTIKNLRKLDLSAVPLEELGLESLRAIADMLQIAYTRRDEKAEKMASEEKHPFGLD